MNWVVSTVHFIYDISGGFEAMRIGNKEMIAIVELVWCFCLLYENDAIHDGS
jgi:hypothetical protein